MTDLNPELIERAAKALWDEPGWEQAAHEQRQHHREAAERALSAVLPDIIQQAWNGTNVSASTGTHAAIVAHRLTDLSREEH